MNQDNIYKKLRIICLIIAIICMGLSLIKRAKADEISVNNLKDYYISELDPNNLQTYNYDSLLDFDTFPYTFMLKNQDGVAVFMWKYDNYILKAMNDGDLNSTYKWTTYMFGGNSNNDQIAFKNTWSRNNTNAVGRILIYDSSRSPSFVAADYYATDDPHFNSANTYCWASGASRQITDIPYNKSRVDQYIMSSTRASDIYIPDNITVHYCGYGTYVSGSTYKGVILDSFPNVYRIKEVTNNTDGFEVYKYGSSGSERLVCDFANCISISNAVANSSTIQIAITIDGIDQTFNFDSSSTYYDYSVSNHIAKYSFPLSIFGINSDTISAKLKEVTIVNTTLSPGGSGSKNIVWLTPLTLVGSDYDDLEPEVIPDAPDYTLNVNNQQYYEYIEDKITSTWVEDVTQSDVQNYVDGNTLICAYQRGYTWADWWNDWSGFFANVQDLPTYIFDNSPSSTDEFKEKMMDFLKNNYGSLYFDTVIITWDPRNGELPLIYVWKTHLYQLKNTNSILKDMAEDLNISAFYTKQSYFDIKGRLDDFEEKSLTKLNEMVGLQEMENGFISSLQSILNQILNALLNLNIEIPEADYSSITSRLDQIISNQGNGNINNDWYDDYRSWLYGKDATDDIISPHEFFIEVFDPIKNTYDAFVNNNAIAGYIADMDLFVEYLSGKIEDNLTIYFKDGIGSVQFDINDNTMLTTGGT